MKTLERRDLVERFRKRNPAPGAEWTVNEEALSLSLTVVDPFAGFLRRARRAVHQRPMPATPLTDAEAASVAREFVKNNADLLGLPRHVVPSLGEHVRMVEPRDHAAPSASLVVRFDAPFSTKGYEGFHEVDNLADVEVFVDGDGQVSSFVNLSRVHPHLTLDTKPSLPEDDRRVMGQLVGRSVFALIDDHRRAIERPPSQPARPLDGSSQLPDVRELGRLPLGQIRAEDVTHVQLVIHESTGPKLAWLAYRLAYFVEIAKPVPAEAFVGDESAAGGPQFFFFRYVVDADTGDVLEDARPPMISPQP